MDHRVQGLAMGTDRTTVKPYKQHLHKVHQEAAQLLCHGVMIKGDSCRTSSWVGYG